LAAGSTKRPSFEYPKKKGAVGKMSRYTAQITPTTKTALMLIWSARRHGHRATAAQRPHIQSSR